MLISGADSNAIQGQPPPLRRCLGPVAVTAQAIGTVGLTLTAVFNIPEAMRSAGSATWISYALALVAMWLVGETLVLFRQQPGSPNGIAAYVAYGLGPRPGALASWTLLLAYGATLIGLMVFFGSFLDLLFHHVGWPCSRLLAYLIGSLGCLELSRRDVRLSTNTMLLTELISVLIILSLTVMVLIHGWGPADVKAINPLADTFTQVRAGLMVAALSFMGFESAANLGQEALQPERAVPRSIRLALLISGGLFLFWGAFLPEGLAWLPTAARNSLDPLSVLADRLGVPGAGNWIKVGTLLCLFGGGLGALTAMARLIFGLAQQRLLPSGLGRVHRRYGTPARALLSGGLPLVAAGAVVVQLNLNVSQIFNVFGGFSVLCFLVTYGLVCLSSLQRPLAGFSNRRRRVVGGCALLAVSAIGVGYLSTVLGHQNGMVLTFGLLLGVGLLRILMVVPADQSVDAPLQR